MIHMPMGSATILFTVQSLVVALALEGYKLL